MLSSHFEPALNGSDSCGGQDPPRIDLSEVHARCQTSERQATHVWHIALSAGTVADLKGS